MLPAQVLEVATAPAELRELLTQGGLAAGKLRAFTDEHLGILLRKGFCMPDTLATADEDMLTEQPALPPTIRRALLSKFNPDAPTASTPSKKPRAGFQACFLFCSTLHCGHEVAVYPCWGPYTVLACKKVAWGSRKLRSSRHACKV